MNDSHDLELILRSHIPIVVLQTREEQHALKIINKLQFRLATPMFQWTITEGLQRMDLDFDPQSFSTDPADLLGNIKSGKVPGIYVLLDFHPYLEEPKHVRLIKDIALTYAQTQQTLVLISHDIELPPELQNYSARVELDLPDKTAIKRIVKQVAIEWSDKNRNKKVKTDPTSFDLLVKNLSGLTQSEIKRLARTAIFDDGAITQDDLDTVMKTKYSLLNKDGMLHYEYDTEKFSNVGGFDKLKTWLTHRKPAFEEKLPGMDTPKGILLLGVQGCGKSLAAKSVAGSLGIPLLRMDFSSLFNKYHGETERNLRESLKSAETMSPCVLWIDELEKGLSTSDSDGGTSKRVLGTFLTWMAEKQKPVFLVATANDITSLPPELVRKGRFDEIFFVDLPDAKIRSEIFRIHLNKRQYNADQYDVAKLAEVSDGFSGSEIEQSIVSAVYLAHAQKVTLNNHHLIREIESTRPLSVVMAEQINALRDWARDRTVPVQ